MTRMKWTSIMFPFFFSLLLWLPNSQAQTACEIEREIERIAPGINRQIADLNNNRYPEDSDIVSGPIDRPGFIERMESREHNERIRQIRAPLDRLIRMDVMDPVRLRITISSLTVSKVDDSGIAESDEPYIIAHVIQKRRQFLGAEIPPYDGRTWKAGVFDGVDDGERIRVNQTIYGFEDQPQVNDPDDLLIFLAAIDNDDSSPETAQATVDNWMKGSYAIQSLTQIDNISQKRRTLLNHFSGALEATLPATAPVIVSKDDIIGDPISIEFEPHDLRQVECLNKVVIKHYPFNDPDSGASYSIALALSRR